MLPFSCDVTLEPNFRANVRYGFRALSPQNLSNFLSFARRKLLTIMKDIFCDCKRRYAYRWSTSILRCCSYRTYLISCIPGMGYTLNSVACSMLNLLRMTPFQWLGSALTIIEVVGVMMLSNVTVH